MRESGYITDLSHKLWTERWTNPFKLHNNRVLWKF